MLAQRQKLAGITIPQGLSEPAALALQGAIGESFVAGFRWVMLLCTGLALLSALSVWWLIGGRPWPDRTVAR